MAKHFPGEICIGGPIPRRLLAQLTQLRQFREYFLGAGPVLAGRRGRCGRRKRLNGRVVESNPLYATLF
jgi:hypothetical protein